MAISIRTLQRRLDSGELFLDPPGAVLYAMIDGEAVAVNEPVDEQVPFWQREYVAAWAGLTKYGFASVWLEEARAELTKEAKAGDKRAGQILDFMPFAYAAGFTADMEARYRAAYDEAAWVSLERSVGTASSRRIPYFGHVRRDIDPQDPFPGLAEEVKPRDTYIGVTPHERRFGRWKMVAGAEAARSHAFHRDIDARTPWYFDTYWRDQLVKLREHGVPDFQHGDDFG